jgi:hypothetical protein
MDETGGSSMGPHPMGMQRSDVPMAAPAPFGGPGQVLFEMRLDFLGYLGRSRERSLYRNEQLKERPPPVLSSLPLETWAVIVKEMEEWQQLNGFYNCPNAEKACMFSGCCCCTMALCWFHIGGYAEAPSDLMARATIINRELAPHGLVVEGDDRVMDGKYLVFRVP